MEQDSFPLSRNHGSINRTYHFHLANIWRVARELGALTVGVVTKPFMFEGRNRQKNAEEGIRALKESPDSLTNASNFDIPTFLRKHAD